MKNRIKLFGVIALVAVIGFSMAACGGGDSGGNDNGGDNSGGKTKFEGRWLNLVAIDVGFTDFSFTFTGNNFVFRSAGRENNTYNGSFTFTDTTITFIPVSGQTWQTFTQDYTLSGNVLNLAQSGQFAFAIGPFTKQ